MLPNLCELPSDELRAEIKRHRAFLKQAHRTSPVLFRSLIRRLDGDRPIAHSECRWQTADFVALDASWEAVVTGGGVGVGGVIREGDSRSVVRRAWLERPRGHSKTSDMAVMVAWALVAGDTPITGLAAAVDRDQAGLLRRAVGRLVDANRGRLGELKVTEKGVRNQVTGSEMLVISSDAASSYGELVDFVLCDELCHWAKPDLWHSLLSTAAKRAHCLLVVLTNAGVGTGWQWQARELSRTSAAWHFSSLSGSQAPWITADVLDEQKRMLPEPVYRRLWLNEWQQSDGEFVTLAEAEDCRSDILKEVSSGTIGTQYVAAIDYGEKRDYTTAVVAHHDGQRIVIDRLDVAVPSSSRPVPTRWVEDWIERQSAAFLGLRIWVDEYQLVGLIQKFETRLPISRFAFGSGRGNHQLAVTLRQAIVNRTIAWPAGCGAIERGDGQRDDLETELASLILRQSAGGRIRFDHAPSQHDDRAFVVAVACLKLIEQPTDEWMEIGEGWLQD